MVQETVPPENEIPVQEVESKQDEPSKPESEPSEPVPEQTSAADEVKHSQARLPIS